jgi:hypothetical protein
LNLESHKINFDPATDVVFDYENNLPGHPNGMQLFALDEKQNILVEETYYSVGGGFVVTADQLRDEETGVGADVSTVPYGFGNANEMLQLAHESGLSIAQMKLENELVYRSPQQVPLYLCCICAASVLHLCRGHCVCVAVLCWGILDALCGGWCIGWHIVRSQIPPPLLFARCPPLAGPDIGGVGPHLVRHVPLHRPGTAHRWGAARGACRATEGQRHPRRCLVGVCVCALCALCCLLCVYVCLCVCLECLVCPVLLG